VEVLAGRVLVRPTDLARSTAFYRDVLGLAVFREFPGGTVFFLGGGYLEVSGEAAPETTHGRVQLWMQVRDLAAAHRDLAARGVPVQREPRREPWGLHEMWIADPDGLRIVVVEVPPEHPMRRDPRD
jgi:catechol 2,3-dioxygenase-like lactoylglutathione lyase family enzyme